MVKCEITIEYFVFFELRFFSLCGNQYWDKGNVP